VMMVTMIESIQKKRNACVRASKRHVPHVHVTRLACRVNNCTTVPILKPLMVLKGVPSPGMMRKQSFSTLLRRSTAR
jgi:hypothetical protein